MDHMALVMILATVFSPLLAALVAIYVGQELQDRGRRLERQERIFRTLMASRTVGARLSASHVEALNMIEVEFNPRYRKSAPVHRAWRAYLDTLETPTPAAGAPGAELVYSQRDQRFLELLEKMATALGYDFDEITIKNTAYSPIAHGQVEQDLHEIRRGWAEIVRGERPLVISIPAAFGPAGGPANDNRNALAVGNDVPAAVKR